MKDNEQQQDSRYEQEPPLTPASVEPYELPIDNLQLEVAEGEAVARGWTPWTATDDGFERPEFYAVEHAGRRVQGIRAEHRYDASLIQQVAVVPNLALTFSMRFQVDPGARTAKRTRPEGLVVGVGIDPAGETDPRADSVQWALRDLRYSHLVTASVTAMTVGERATLFVRSVAFVPGSDTMAANGVGSLCQTICVRTQYDRTYLLLPPNASQALWEEAARVAQRKNWTVGGSADDAGLGASLLSPRPRVIAVNPLAWQNSEAPLGLTGGWFATNYPPGVVFSSVAENQLNTL